MSDVLDAYQKQWTRENAKYQILSAKKKYKTHDYYQTFRQEVWEVNHRDEQIPDSDDGEDDDDDDDIAVNAVKQAVKCPITQTYLENPVTSRVCKHTYSKHAIMELIRKHRGRVACPIPGCRTMLNHQNLQDDTLAERRVARVRATEMSQRQTESFYDVE
ncbi:zinc-finger of the MIZ type in Nse subunit-domain-containing protein [Zychaea mexicana]|uniref:zinc-finger of the MIZ type in Nse subunit-domain-containing protein n=1 Tax=Zychaea mexicana TaxID=64656 RepID=UPI0022FE2ED4|nr:zinc-finger of the MIZ type in Nse subunit-domain-containing protein [Zychaea mexicana]KAI9490462.1 zinc-finger of the MIZ type in Nse subunit-domain-containing protein [Zychaea mexicana]